MVTADMWQWINDNSGALNALTAVGTMLVWLFYAHLLLSGFRRQRQARVLVNQGWGSEVNSVCLVSNMSHEPIYIQCIFISLHTSQGKYRSSVTDFDDAEPWNSQNKPNEVTRQGPLGSGEYMNLGTFRTLIRQASQQHDLSHDQYDPMTQIGLESFKITVICSYGPEGKVMGIQREFWVDGAEEQRMRPSSIYSRRLTNRRARRKMERWLTEAV